jgi:nickel transport protein
MKTLTRLFAAAFAAGVIVAGGEATAHGMWIAPQGETYAVLYGDGDSAKVDSYDPVRVKQAMAYGDDGKLVSVAINRAEKAVTLLPAARASSLAVLFDNGIWAKSRERGWLREGRSTVSDATEAGYSFKFSKFYARRDGDFSRIFGQGLEIVPLADPIAAKPGDKLTFRVLVNGQPQAGVSFNDNFLSGQHGKTTIKSNAKGEATITVPKAAFAGVAADYFLKKAGDPEVDGTYYNATLTFAVGGMK